MLIRNAEALERLERVDTLVVDKTGTLTEGRPKVTEIVPLDGGREQDLLQVAAALERSSEHPLAAAIVRAAEERGLEVPPATGFDSLTGKGVRGLVPASMAALGNQAMMDELGIPTDAAVARATAMREQGATVMYVARGRKLAGLLAVADPIKATTPAALARCVTPACGS